MWIWTGTGIWFGQYGTQYCTYCTSTQDKFMHAYDHEDYEQRRNMVEIVPGGGPSDIFSTFCRERYFPTSRILKFISSMMVETAKHPINMTGITSWILFQETLSVLLCRASSRFGNDLPALSIIFVWEYSIHWDAANSHIGTNNHQNKTQNYHQSLNILTCLHFAITSNEL